jgi:hypothetical protein
MATLLESVRCVVAAGVWPRQRLSYIKISLVVCNRVRAAPLGEHLVLPPNYRDVTVKRV